MTTGASTELSAEYKVVHTTTALVDRSDRGIICLTGVEASDFLQGQLTNEVNALEPGQGCYAALLNFKGRMLADMRVLRCEDRFFLDTENSCSASLLSNLKTYKIGRKVEIEDASDSWSITSLQGPGAKQAATNLFGDQVKELTEEHQHLRAEFEGKELFLIAADHGVSGIDVLCPSPLFDLLVDRLRQAGAEPVSLEVAECVRIEAGLPRYGIDMTEETLPQEAGILERAVSFEKGCYVGQEVVARMFHRGHPNRHLRGLRSPEQLLQGSTANQQGKKIGQIASVAVSPTFGPIALALLRREVEPGMTVEIGTDQDTTTTATVVKLPFPDTKSIS